MTVEAQNQEHSTYQPPVASRKEHTVKFGKHNDDDPDEYMDPPVCHNDPYFWLRDDRRENEEVLAHLCAENKHVEDFMSDTKDLQEELYQSLMSRVQEDSETYARPRWSMDSEWLYFSRKFQGKGYKTVYRKHRETNEEQLLLDINALAKGHETCVVREPHVTSDHSVMAYATDFEGNEWYDYSFWDVTITPHLQIHKNFPRIRGRAFFLKDSNNLIYTECDEANRAYRVRLFRWDTEEDIVLYEEQEKDFSVGAAATENHDYIIVFTGNAEREKILLFQLEQGQLAFAEPRCVIDHPIKFRSLDYVSSELIYVTSNYGHDQYYALFTATLDNLSDPEKWQVYLADPTVDVNHVHVTQKYVVMDMRVEDRNYCYINEHGQTAERRIELCPSDYTEDMGIRNEHIITYFDSNQAYYYYETAVIPTRIALLDLDTRQTQTVWCDPVPNYEANLYSSERIYVSVRDGERVPCTVCRRKDLTEVSKVYLYGYGSYGITIDPNFSRNMFTYLDQGFIYVIAHVRGSSMKGESWHLQGKMYNKLNTFYDFIDVAQYLHETYPEAKIATEGRSAGGMLMGVVYNMAPELFDVVVAGVPFVDVLNSMQDKSIPLTVGEWTHWGNPNIRKDYDYMSQYSPYDNIVSNTAYPTLLLLAGLNDPRVAYWEPAKFAAKLRYLNPDVKCYLKTELELGHFGKTDRYSYYREKAHDLAFVIKSLN